MPDFQVMSSRLNQAFKMPEIQSIDASLFAPGCDLFSLASEHEVARSAGELAFLQSLPRGILEAVRALIYDNLQRAEPLAITFAWAPAYDWELNIWECPGTTSRGGITVLLRSRYPADPHPQNI